jgi:hypothetical protein
MINRTSCQAMIASAVMAVAVAGCGGASHSSPTRAHSATIGSSAARGTQPTRSTSGAAPQALGPAAVTRAYFAALATGDGTAACAKLTPSFVATVRAAAGGAESCPQVIAALQPNVKSLIAAVKIEQVHTVGDQATVTAAAASRPVHVLLTKAAGGEWRITGGGLGLA